MSSRRLFQILIGTVIVLGASVYFSQKFTGPKPAPEVVVEAPSAEPVKEIPQKTKPTRPSDEDISGVPSEVPDCHLGEAFAGKKQELGKIVNRADLREGNIPEFLKQINGFFAQSGLPLPLAISSAKLLKEGAVFNNCRATCRGSVHEVFVTKISGSNVEVLTKDGTLKKLKLHDGGIEVASVDELSKKGIPFHSWLAPVSDNDWYISGNFLYYSLDIEGLWLKIDTASRWEVVSRPQGLDKLKAPDEPLTIPGCNLEEQCFVAGIRHFKAPKICGK